MLQGFTLQDHRLYNGTTAMLGGWISSFLVPRFRLRDLNMNKPQKARGSVREPLRRQATMTTCKLHHEAASELNCTAIQNATASTCAGRCANAPVQPNRSH